MRKWNGAFGFLFVGGIVACAVESADVGTSEQAEECGSGCNGSGGSSGSGQDAGNGSGTVSGVDGVCADDGFDAFDPDCVQPVAFIDWCPVIGIQCNAIGNGLTVACEAANLALYGPGLLFDAQCLGWNGRRCIRDGQEGTRNCNANRGCNVNNQNRRLQLVGVRPGNCIPLGYYFDQVFP